VARLARAASPSGRKPDPTSGQEVGCRACHDPVHGDPAAGAVRTVREATPNGNPTGGSTLSGVAAVCGTVRRLAGLF
jgi:hypothetical protein